MHGHTIAERLLNYSGWIVGFALALSVSLALIGETLIIPFIPEGVSALIGWIIIIFTLLGVILAFKIQYKR